MSYGLQVDNIHLLFVHLLFTILHLQLVVWYRIWVVSWLNKNTFKVVKYRIKKEITGTIFYICRRYAACNSWTIFFYRHYAALKGGWLRKSWTIFLVPNYHHYAALKAAYSTFRLDGSGDRSFNNKTGHSIISGI